ncbi:FimD/PapC N-terminal domain-containing protein [Shigella flexneri]
MFRLRPESTLTGQYDIDIYVNKQWRGKYDMIVKDNPQETCLSIEVIKRLGINSDNFASGKQCLTFEQLVQGGSYTSIRGFLSRFQCPAAGWKN